MALRKKSVLFHQGAGGNVKVGLFCYSNSTNVGDFIQTLAVAQHLDQEYHLVDRDFMNQYDGEPMAVVMNGWFTDEPDNWPPSPSIIPVFLGFHISRESAAIIREHKEYFKRYAPIGCRDHMTAEYMRECSIDAYVSGCATMTFPRRAADLAADKVVLVDEPLRNFLRSERRDFVFISHELEPYMSQPLRFQAASELLDFYRENAGLIITRRIHCAMPCAAMGIPVVFSGMKDGRTRIVDILGLHCKQAKRYPRSRLADFPREVVEFEEKKRQITEDLHARLVALGVKVKVPAWQ